MTPQRGEIWLVHFDPQVGTEIQKTRPAVVINMPFVEEGPLRLVVPILGHQPYHEQIVYYYSLPADSSTGLQKASSINCLQVKSFALSRFIKKIGTVSTIQLDELTYLVTLCIRPSL